MKTLLTALLLSPLALAQQLQPVTSVQPDCAKFSTPIRIAGTVTTATVDNRQAACDGWVVTYASNGFASVSVLLQSAPLVTPTGGHGTFVSFAGTILAGFSNPSTVTTQAEIRATGYFPYVNVAITTTGTGYLQLEFHGYKTNPNSGSSSGGSGCPGTIGTPCVVVGPTAAGSPPTTSPVLVAGWDGTNIQTLLTCPNRANITLTTSGLTRIITGTAAKKIRLCSLSIAFASPVNVQIVEGTQAVTACDTGATNMTGTFQQVVGFDPNWSNTNPLAEATNADDVCVSLGTSVNGGGVAIYALF